MRRGEGEAEMKVKEEKIGKEVGRRWSGNFLLLT